MTYPAWSYFPRNVRPPAWAASFVEVVRAAGAKISTVELKTGLRKTACWQPEGISMRSPPSSYGAPVPDASFLAGANALGQRGLQWCRL